LNKVLEQAVADKKTDFVSNEALAAEMAEKKGLSLEQKQAQQQVSLAHTWRPQISCSSWWVWV
jgi:hypothetical protein